MPHYSFAVYDEETGEITGRIRTNSKAIAESYQNKIELTDEEAAAEPEKHRRVDIAHLKATGRKRLRAKD